jgi:hypothetical protein
MHACIQNAAFVERKEPAGIFVSPAKGAKYSGGSSEYSAVTEYWPGFSKTPCFRFHIPLIEPDRPISGIRLSEKGSRGRPRETARPLGKADKAEHGVQEWLRKPLGSRPHHFVLGTQPLT